jgi:hypothetical protein
MNIDEMKKYLQMIVDLCSNGNSDDAYRAEELAKILKSHVEYGTPLEAMDTVIDRLWLSGDY